MVERNFKLVKQDEHNTDQYLIGFYKTESDAYSERLHTQKRHSEWIKSWKDLIVKRVDPDVIPDPVATDYAHYIRSLIPDEEWLRVMQSDAAAEIDSNNSVCGFGGRTYYNLSKMIPKEWTVIDIGCAYNPQSYLFTQHAKHIAVEPQYIGGYDFHFEYFQAPNTDLVFASGQKFIKKILPKMKLDLKRTFAICNFVPSDECCQMVRETFPNVFTFYPA